MPSDKVSTLSPEERRILLTLARKAIDAATSHRMLPQPGKVSQELNEYAACFITLLRRGELRGCTGTLAARRPLVDEVIFTAAQTALHDPRFHPVRPDEVPSLEIEISILSPQTKIEIAARELLPQLLRPGIDGVTLTRGLKRSTFLPQVWSKIPDPIDFLEALSQKMGVPATYWKLPDTQVEIYQVEEFSDHESNPGQFGLSASGATDVSH